VIRHTKYYEPGFSHDGAGLYYSAFPPPPKGRGLSAPDVGNALYYHSLRHSDIGRPESISGECSPELAIQAVSLERRTLARGGWG